MMCSVPNCNNTEATANKDVIFHCFPNTPIKLQEWQLSLGINRTITDNDRVCSEHFSADSYTLCSVSQRLKLRKGSLPVRNMVLRQLVHLVPKVVQAPKSPSAAPAPSSVASVPSSAATLRPKFKVCRVCLSSGARLQNINELGLERAYEIILGIDLSVPLPSFLCWECAHRLRSALKFQQRAKKARSVISRIINRTQSTQLKIDDVMAKDRSGLKTSLGITTYAPNHYNLLLISEDDLYSEVKNENDSMFVDNIDGADDDTTNDTVETVQIKEEPNNYAEIKINDVYQLKTSDNLLASSDDDEYFIKMDADDKNYGENSVKNTLLNNITKYIPKQALTDRNVNRNHEIKINAPEEKTPSNTDEEILVDVGNKKKSCAKRIVKKQRKCITGRKKPKIMLRKKGADLDEKSFTITTLSYEEQVEDEKQRRNALIRSYRSSAYKCEICDQRCSTSRTLHLHMQKHDPRLPWECAVCKVRVRNRRALLHHVASCHSTRYQCRLCPFTTHHKTVAVTHKDTHTGKIHQCRYCDMSFSRVTTRNNHMRLKHPCAFACVQCGFTFRNQQGLDQHWSRRHRGVEPPAPQSGPHCEECALTFASQVAYQRHYERSAVHNDERNVLSVNNSSQKEWPPGTALGVDRRRGPRTVPQNRRPPGAKIQDGINTAMCEHCGKVMSQNYLESHMWVHTGVKPFKCDLCGKSFTQKNTLKIHVDMRHKTNYSRAYVCRVCGDAFDYPGNLLRHTKTVHNGVKRFNCDICKKQFSSKKGRDDHVAHVHMNIPWPKRVRTRKKKSDGDKNDVHID